MAVVSVLVVELVLETPVVVEVRYQRQTVLVLVNQEVVQRMFQMDNLVVRLELIIIMAGQVDGVEDQEAAVVVGLVEPVPLEDLHSKAAQVVAAEGLLVVAITHEQVVLAVQSLTQLEAEEQQVQQQQTQHRLVETVLQAQVAKVEAVVDQAETLQEQVELVVLEVNPQVEVAVEVDQLTDQTLEPVEQVVQV